MKWDDLTPWFMLAGIRALLFFCMGSLLACMGKQTAQTQGDEVPNPGPVLTPEDQTPVDSVDAAENQPEVRPEFVTVSLDLTTLKAETARSYLARLAPLLLGRVMTEAENDRLEAEGGAAIPSIISSWTTEPGLANAAKRLIELKLRVSGKTADIDYGLPGNLAKKLVTDARPWSELLSARDCYDNEGKPISCDTGAPYRAGLLTTPRE